MYKTWKCPRCGTQFLEPVKECDWCPGIRPEESKE